MEDLTLDQLKTLAQQTQSPSISIYLPTHRAGNDTQQNPLRFKNLLRDAEKQLLESGLGPRPVTALLSPAQDLLKDGRFWNEQYDGLAVFIAENDFHFYRLPFAVQPLLVIASNYFVKPILPLFTNNGHFYILAVSQNDVRLFEGARHAVGQIDLPEGTPTSLAEALQFDDPEKQLQMHSVSVGGASMFHGQGPGDEEQKVRIERYLNQLDDSLHEIFREQTAPLVLAGVEHLLPIYHKVSGYAHIVPEAILGNPDHLRPDELHAKAWPIVRPHFRAEVEKVLASYNQLAGSDKASNQIETIVNAAYFGRVQELVLAADSHVWGAFDAESGQVTHYQTEQSEKDNLALLDFAALKTLENGGKVYAIKQANIPTEKPCIAIMRY